MGTVFFLLSKLVGLMIRAETFIVLLLILSLFAFRRGRMRAGQGALSLSLILLITLGLLPLGDLALRPLETRFPANPVLAQVHGIILLGGAEDPATARHWNQHALNDAAERYTAATTLARRFPDAVVLFTGGSGRVSNQSEKEAPMAGQLLQDLGVDPTRLRLEDRARNTAENARNSFAMMQPKPREVWVLVTSAAHMPRALGSFCTAGWQVIPYPVDYRTGDFQDGIEWDLAGHLGGLNSAIKEWVGLVSYFAAGHTNAVFPQGCPET